jgi:plasmid stabilization system protein ParE
VSHYRLVFRQEALQQLEELYDFIADAGSPATAAGFTESIVAFCEGLADFSLAWFGEGRPPSRAEDDRLQEACRDRLCHFE